MAKEIPFYVASNAKDVVEPLFVCRLNQDTGAIKLVKSYGGIKSTSYLTISRDRQHLYTVVGGSPSQVSAWEMHGDHLHLLGMSNVDARGACHLSLSTDEKSLFSANYSSGQVSVVPLSQDGGLLDVSQVLTLKGSGPNQQRQQSSHMHFINTTPCGDYVLAADLGSDKVMVYLYNQEAGILEPYPLQPFWSVEPGAGPRHLAYHPSKPYVYLLNELNATVDFVEFCKEDKMFKPQQSYSLMAKDFDGFNKSAAIRVHPNGRFLYGSNRGDLDSITVFEIMEDGSLTFVERQAEGIDWPRDFNIDPSGKYLLSAGKNANEIRVFEIDEKTGALEATENTLTLEGPVCILF